MMYAYLFTNFINQSFFAAQNCSGASIDVGGNSYCTGLSPVNAGNSALQTALSIFFGALAAIAVLMIIITALRLIVNSGEPENVKRLRRTLTYAAVGLILALTADAIVGFVLGKL